MKLARLALVAALVAPVALIVPGAEATSYPNAAWSPAASCNYTSASREASHNIDMVVIHTAQGSYSGTINWFKNCAAGASAHYVVSKTGAITAMVRDEDIGWQAGHWTTNTRSIGIEHEGFVSDPNAYTPAMYQASAALTRWLSDRYAIPRDRAHIIGHNEVPGCARPGGGGSACHTDPGPYWDWNYYMSLVNGGGGDTSPPTTPSLAEDHTGSAWSRHSSPNWRYVASDPESGIRVYELAPSWGGSFLSGATSYHPTLGDGEHALRVRAQNGAGQWGGWSPSVGVRIDTQPPGTSFSLEGGASAGGVLYSSSASRAVLAASDARAGVASTSWSLDGGAAQAYTGPIALDVPEGPHTLQAWSADHAGNVEAARSFGFTMDRTPPTVALASPTSNAVVAGSEPIDVQVEATDALSGLARVELWIDGSLREVDVAPPYAWPWPAGEEAAGPHHLIARAFDRAGNVAEARVDVQVVPTGEGGVAATLSRVEGWAQTPPAVGVVVDDDAGLVLGDQWIGVRDVDGAGEDGG